MRRRWYYFKRMLQADRLFVAQMIGNIIRMIQYAGRCCISDVGCVRAHGRISMKITRCGSRMM